MKHRYYLSKSGLLFRESLFSWDIYEYNVQTKEWFWGLVNDPKKEKLIEIPEKDVFLHLL